VQLGRNQSAIFSPRTWKEQSHEQGNGQQKADQKSASEELERKESREEGQEGSQSFLEVKTVRVI
jgi:hypothetical protein